MPDRPGRPLPSVIAGALVAGLLVLGAGTASADEGDTCRVGLLQGVVRGDDCVTLTGAVLGPVVDAVLGTGSASQSSPTSSSPSGLLPRVAEGVGSTVTGLGNAVAGNTSSPAGGSPSSGGSGASNSSGGGSPTDTETTAGDGVAESTPGGPAAGGAPAASGMPAPDVRGAVASASAPGGLLTGVPTLGFGRPNPGLFAPLGSPLRTLTGVSPGSPVTTSSDVQAMAFDQLPGGPGVPAVTGVVILSTLGAFALRHRIFRRVRRHDRDPGDEPTQI